MSARRAFRSYVLPTASGLIVLGLLTATASHGDEIKVRAVAEKSEVYLGEPFLFQIQIEGTNDVAEPDLSGLVDFTVESLGGRANNSQSITIINGQMRRVVERSYLYTYRLTPKRKGSQSIGPVIVEAEGRRHQTQAVTIRVLAPEETVDFKFRLSLSKDSCYVGEPVTLTGVWYVRKSPSNVRFSLPFLSHDGLYVADLEADQDPRREYYRVPADGGEVFLEQGRGVLDGISYTTFTFRKVIIPLRSGAFELAEGAVSCDAPDDRAFGRRSRSPFDDPFFRDFFSDDFFGRRNLRKFVTPARAVTLIAKDLPMEGRPRDFTGHVGSFEIAASAAPTEVNVGDPITLTITLSGPEYLDHITLPPLAKQEELAADFKIPAEMAPGTVEHGVKVFTQTIRATRSDVTEIPPIEIACFDPTKGAYTVVSSESIPITVHETKVVTALDAEGAAALPVKSEVKVLQEGIAHNYDGLDVLENQEFGVSTFTRSPWWAVSVVGPLVAYLVLLFSVTLHRRHHADPRAREARKAHRRFISAMRSLGTSAPESKVLDEIRRYFTTRLMLPSGAMTYRDIESPLRQRDVSAESLATLEAIFRECEAGHYAGARASSEGTTLAQRALAVIAQIERCLK